MAVTGLGHLFVIQVASGGHHTLILSSPRRPSSSSSSAPSSSSFGIDSSHNHNGDYDVHDGTTIVYSFGGGSFGKLGHGQTHAELTPRPIAALRSRCLVEDGDFDLD